MHRIIVHPNGTLRQSAVLRWGSTLAYLMFMAAGGFLLYSPELLNAYGESAVWMAGFVAVGGGLSAMGAATFRWVGEFVGLPLLAGGLAVLGVEAWLRAADVYPWLAAGNTALLIAIALFMVVRWRIVLAIYRFVHELAESEQALTRRGD